MPKHRDPEVELPQICDDCLGPSQDIRMVRDLAGAPCRICTRPFATFTWRPVKNGYREKTRVCRSCSVRKNICQCCLRDLTHGVTLADKNAATGTTEDLRPWAQKTISEAAEPEPDYQLRDTLSESGRKVLRAAYGAFTAVYETLRQQSLTLDGDRTLFLFNADSSLDTNHLRAALSEIALLENLSVTPAARCGYAHFESALEAQKAADRLEDSGGVLVVDGNRLHFCRPALHADVAGSPHDCQRKIAAMVTNYVRSNELPREIA